MWEAGYSLLPSPLIFVTSFPHPPLLLLYCMPPVPVLSSPLTEVSHYPSSDGVPHIGPGDD